jgi:hypothetical protein
MEDVGRLESDYRLQDGPRQRAVADLAARQHGVVAHRQLIELGLSRSAIQRRVRNGRLHCHPEDRTVRDGIPVTSLARTLLDLAEVVNARQLERAFDEADRRGLFDLRALERLRARSRGRQGLKPLARVIEEKRPEPPMTRSELENGDRPRARRRHAHRRLPAVPGDRPQMRRRPARTADTVRSLLSAAAAAR